MWQVMGEEDPGMWQAHTSNVWPTEASIKWLAKQDEALSMWQCKSDEVPSIWQDRQKDVPNMWQERQDEVPIMWQSNKDDFSTNRYSNDKVLVPSMSEFYHEDDEENTIWPLKQKEDQGFRQ